MNPAAPWIHHFMVEEGLSYPEARALLEGYEVIPCIENGVHKGSFLKRNAEIHFAGFVQYRNGLITRRRLREFLLPLLTKHGFLVTKLGPGEPDSFITRLGFVEIGQSPSHRIFMLTSIRPLENHHDATRT